MKVTNKTTLADFVPYMNRLILVKDETGDGSIGTLISVTSGGSGTPWLFYYAHKVEPVYLYNSRTYTIALDNQKELL